jgi:predicted nucleic acid-binding protein
VSEDSPAPIVVDASVAVKWLLDEPLSDVAEQLYNDSSAFHRPLVAPSLLPNEVTNAIYQQLRRGGLVETEADAAVVRFARLDVQLLAPPELPQEAYAFAKRHRLGAIYDSLYVVLAQRLGAELWTDDRSLLNSVGPAAPWIRWLGDYPAAGP